MSKSIFIKDPDQYSRKVDPVADYVKQAGLYLHIQTGTPIDQCEKYIKDKIKNKSFKNFRNPTVVFFEREENGDRFVKSQTLSTYLKTASERNFIMVPTLTCYQHPTIEESIIVEYMDENTVDRKKAKLEAFKAEVEGDEEKYEYMQIEQINKKGDNNIVSGVFLAVGTVLQNPSAHTTLTSVTRYETSLANANNERMIGGNRHYRDPQTTIASILVILNNTDLNIVDRVIQKYSLVYPTAEQTMEVILKSIKYYWRSPEWENKIRDLLYKLTPTQRAIFVYSGDLYHIRVFNDSFMRMFLSKLSSKVYKEVEDPLSFIHSAPESVVNLTHQICFTDVMGKGKEYKVMLNNNDPAIQYLVGTIDNIIKVTSEYTDFIQCFLLNDNLPIGASYLPDIIRQGVVLGDTDSTCVSKDEWINWYEGQILLNDTTRALIGGVMYIAAETLINILAIFSTNMNVRKEKINFIKMKSEFYWDVMVVCNVAKHYYALTRIKEGNVYGTPKLEKKGVHLKSSNLPREVISLSENMMMDILVKVSENKKLHLGDYLQQTIEMENRVMNSLLNGGIEYCKQVTIKDPESYIEEEDESFYRHHIFWQEVFEEKYGDIGETPYKVVKFSTTLKNTTSLTKWINNIEDTQLRQRLLNWVIKNEKKDLPTIYLPLPYIESYGVIEEIKPIINTTKIAMDVCKILYIILESIGYFKKPKVLISDVHTKR